MMRESQQSGARFPNLGRLYWLPEAARADQNGWSNRHTQAVRIPQSPFERALVSLLGGWLLYADAHRNAYATEIQDDALLGKSWARIGEGLRGLLDGELGRLDVGTLDAILGNTLDNEGADG